jgi:hypothetical protein
MEKKWLGKTYKCPYGVMHGDVFKVTESSPQKTYDHGYCEQQIKGVSQYYGEMKMSLEDLEVFYVPCSEKEYEEIYKENQMKKDKEKRKIAMQTEQCKIFFDKLPKYIGSDINQEVFGEEGIGEYLKKAVESYYNIKL